MANDDDFPLRIEFGKPGRNIVHRNVQAAFNVAVGVFLRFAYVEQQGFGVCGLEIAFKPEGEISRMSLPLTKPAARIFLIARRRVGRQSLADPPCRRRIHNLRQTTIRLFDGDAVFLHRPQYGLTDVSRVPGDVEP